MLISPRVLRMPPLRTIALSSRWLVGLAFTFAVQWKAALSPDFLDQRFFCVTLTDPRFGETTWLITGLSADELEANRQAPIPLPHGAELLTPPVGLRPTYGTPRCCFAAASPTPSRRSPDSDGRCW